MTTSTVNSKNDIVNRMGGMTQYEMTIMDFCERLRTDKELGKFYGNMDIDSLFLFQKETLEWAFGDFATPEERHKAENRIKLRHYRLLKSGLSDQHFDAILQQFVEAMRESWVEDDVVNDATRNLQCLHRLLRTMQPASDGQHIWFQVADEADKQSEPETARTPSLSTSTKQKISDLFHNLTPRAA